MNTDHNTTECIEARMWDSEARNSPFSTVADIEDEYCEECEAAEETYCPECHEYLTARGMA